MPSNERELVELTMQLAIERRALEMAVRDLEHAEKKIKKLEDEIEGLYQDMAGPSL